jgi:hypothetical protein
MIRFAPVNGLIATNTVAVARPTSPANRASPIVSTKDCNSGYWFMVITECL